MSSKQDDNQHNAIETPRADSVAFEDAQAAAATNAEHNAGLLANLKKFPHAVGWSVLLSATIIMEGFDIVLINSLLAVPAFQRAFGEQMPDGSWEITAAWQAGLTNGALAGQVMGLFLNGIIADRYGFRKTMIGALMATTAFIFIVFFTQSLPQLLVGLFLCGIPWGVFQTLTGTYAAEVCPTNLRSYLTSYVNMKSWVIGQFLASAVLQGVGERTDQWAYRIPYALQWMFPVPLIIGIYLAPESPWWLVRKGRLEDAKKVLVRLAAKNSPTQDLDNMVQMMEQTNEYEKTLNEGTSYFNCFKGADLRRTEIVCAVWLVQTLCGSTFMGYSTYFYQQAGLDVSASFSMSLGQYALGLIGVVVSWFLMPHFGRRTLYVYGQASLCCLLLIIGFVGIPARQDNDTARWVIGSMLLIFTFVYDATVGPVCYSLVTELPSTRLRQKTVVLARNAYNIASIVTNVLTTQQLNPGAWNWGPYSAFFWAGTGAVMFVWSFFRLPEPKNRTYGELDVLFNLKVPARRFAQTNVNVETHGVVENGVEKGETVFVEKC
ncbi:hypothetical protein MBLNU230_g1251t1 [Neophaeotheca triangularis]